MRWAVTTMMIAQRGSLNAEIRVRMDADGVYRE